MAGNLSWEKMISEISICRRCDLWKGKTNYVIGSGSKNAKIMLVGEAPGASEDKAGLPFVGRSGKLLDEMLENTGLARDDVYITNIVKCRPPHNRDPKKSEKSACSPFLLKQINLVRPRLIVALGRHSMEYFFDMFSLKRLPISKCHGTVFGVDNDIFRGKLLVLFHPAVAIYNKNMKKTLFSDFGKIKSYN
ncbi:MAG: uracil-DNA glycosylase [Candidatus Micrarchaeota archaeon]|nr:uracil-DNA glycosylase [Candidatus Micrarchaeota archaeon]